MPTDPPPYPDFGNRLRIAREASGYGGAADMARALGINEQTYRNYERGQRIPDPDLLERFILEFNISLDWLFGGVAPALRINRR